MSRNKDDFVDISSSDQINKIYGKKRRRKGLAKRVIVLLLSIVMLLSGSAFVYYYSALDSLNFKNIDDTEETTSDSTATVEGASNNLLSSTKVLNILLFGQDAAASEDEKYGRSDTTILLSIDNINKKLKMTSFQRDTYVTIPGYGDNKLNSAFSLGGVSLSIKTIEANFGIKVDKYACVDFDSFREIIKVLGGVDIELTLEEIQYINAQIDVNDQTDRTKFIDYDPNLQKQKIHLDGYQALWYARDRGADSLGGISDYSFSGDDWDRTARQRNLLTTIVNNLKDAPLTDLVQIVNKVGPLVTTNLKKSDITFLVQNLISYMKYDIEQISIPVEGTWRYGKTDDGQSVIVINDWDKVRYDLASFIYEDSVSSQTSSSTTGTQSAASY